MMSVRYRIDMLTFWQSIALDKFRRNELGTLVIFNDTEMFFGCSDHCLWNFSDISLFWFIIKKKSDFFGTIFANSTIAFPYFFWNMLRYDNILSSLCYFRKCQMLENIFTIFWGICLCVRGWGIFTPIPGFFFIPYTI